jgi:hypothetical protein
MNIVICPRNRHVKIRSRFYEVWKLGSHISFTLRINLGRSRQGVVPVCVRESYRVCIRWYKDCVGSTFLTVLVGSVYVVYPISFPILILPSLYSMVKPASGGWPWLRIVFHYDSAWAEYNIARSTRRIPSGCPMFVPHSGRTWGY